MPQVAGELLQNSGMAAGDGPVPVLPFLRDSGVIACDDGQLEARATILDAAARCFMSAGYTASSIDDVADRLNATKGRVYHYYRSKADLFFDVHRLGMAINLQSIRPIVQSGQPVLGRYEKMCRVHLSNMLEYNIFQRVVMQGVEMHLSGATTPAQRDKLVLLMEEREEYEILFRDILVEGRKSETFRFEKPSMASKAVLAILNNPVLWYRRRDNEQPSERAAIIDEFTDYAVQAVGARLKKHTEE